LFSQYAMTLTGISMGTGYALYRKPKNGLGIMIVAGAAGTIVDLAYGLTVACRPQLQARRCRLIAEKEQQLALPPLQTNQADPSPPSKRRQA
jgi:hypothetical protein